jgi:hypothetical protein
MLDVEEPSVTDVESVKMPLDIASTAESPNWPRTRSPRFFNYTHSFIGVRCSF